MPNISQVAVEIQEENISDRLEECTDACTSKFNRILSDVISKRDMKAHKMEQSIFKWLLELGLLLLELYFASHNQGNCGKTIKTDQGMAERGRPSQKVYFSIFGKVKVWRYLYHIGDMSFAPLDICLNLPVRCYSYFLREFSNLITINGAFNNTSKLLKKFFGLKLSVSALETISKESSVSYEDYYDIKITLPKPEREEDFTVVQFDGKGVPMIKKEAAKIVARQGKGEKKQKKKEALVGAKYDVNANVRTPEEVAENLVYPDKKEDKKETAKDVKAKNIRYIASIEKTKKEVMEEIHNEVKHEDFSKSPSVCVMDGALHLWATFGEVFKDIESMALILDIIHVVEYIYLIAHVKHKSSKDKRKQYVYDKLLLILRGNVASYILELQNEMMSGKWGKSKLEIFSKVIKYLKNHKQYMKYDEYLKKGYPIGSGVVESACSHVVKDRMEISGARWGIDGAESILKLRAISKSNDWDEYWEFHTSQANKNIFLSDDYNPLIPKLKLVA